MQINYPVRVFFEKKNSAKYFSHLDLNRAVARILMRSGLPVVFTEGFNPHAKVVFAVPLSIYQESSYEIFDFSLYEELPFETVAEKLSEATVPDLPIIKAAPPVMKLGDCTFANYTITLSTSAAAVEAEQALTGEIVVLKKTKKDTAPVDISPQIKCLKAVQAGMNTLELHCTLAAAANNYLNPRYIVTYLSEKLNITSYEIKRTALLNGAAEYLI